MKWTMPVLLSTLAVAVVGSTIAVATGTSDDDYAFFDPIIDIRAMLERHYVEDIDDEDLQAGAIRGMLETLNDPYTVYVPPQDTAEFAKDLTGEYVGIGAEVGLRSGWFTILTPLDDSPAWRAGVMADDRVVAIDGETTEGLTTDECIELLMGQADTEVIITVVRDGSEPLDIAIVRSPIHVNPVKGFARAEGGEGAWRYLLDPAAGIAYVRLAQFTPDCAAELADAMETAERSNGGPLGGLVLDLRFNPGGVLGQAIEIADLFLEEGVIVSTEGRTSDRRVERAKPGGSMPDVPIVVLINGQSASASEILAGALAENGRAATLGTRTFGKGLVQTVRPLPGDDGVLKITEQRYALASGRVIQRDDDSSVWGVDPTPGFYLPLTDEETGEMLTARREQEIISAKDSTLTTDADELVERLRDPQLRAALRVVRHAVETGELEPVGIPENNPADLAGDAVTAARSQRDRLLRELVRIERRITAAESSLPPGARDDERDLWDDDAPVQGGTLTVTDAEGNTVAVLTVTGPDLERWLVDAGVEPAELASEPPAPTEN
ncbi:MAG: S41 family peptidase [Planctomycetota bacterium]